MPSNFYKQTVKQSLNKPILLNLIKNEMVFMISKISFVLEDSIYIDWSGKY